MRPSTITVSHVVAVGEVDQARDRHVQRVKVRPAQVQQHDVGLLADLQRADVLFHAERLGAVDGAHLEHAARRQPGGVFEERPVVMHALLHVAEHVAGSVRRGGVGSDAHIGARIEEFRHRAATENGSDGARDYGRCSVPVSATMRISSAVRSVECERRAFGPRMPSSLRVGDAALVVAVLRENEAALTGEARHLDGLFARFREILGAQRFHMLRTQGRRDQRDVEAAAMGAVPGVDQFHAGFVLAVEIDGIFVRRSVLDARIGARMGRTGRADGDDGAGADFAHAFAMGVAVDRIVGPQDRVAAPSSDTPVVTPKRSRSSAARRASARQNSGVEATV